MIPYRWKINVLYVYVKTHDTVHSWYVCVYNELSTLEKKSELQQLTLKPVSAKVATHWQFLPIQKCRMEKEKHVEHYSENSEPILISNGHYSMLFMLPEAITNSN